MAQSSRRFFYGFRVVATTPHTKTTPIVRRHAEACLSTTRAKSMRARIYAVAARWAGVIPQQKLRPAGWVLPDVQIARSI